MQTTDPHSGAVLGRSGGFAVINCGHCGYAHLDPLPDEAELGLVYERAYYSELNPGWLDKDRSEAAYWELEHADKISDWSRWLGRSGVLLDVGCSGGLLLEYARSRGWEAAGIEPEGSAVEHARARGLEVHQGLYADVDLPEASVDVVHAKLVLEHLPRPGHFLAWARRLLGAGGIVSIQVPNEFNALQLAARDSLGKEDWWIAPPFHVNYFTFETIEALLRSAGFEVVGRDATFPMEWFLLMGDDYVGNDEVGRLAHRRRMTLEQELERVSLRRPLHAHLAQHGVGREAIVHARTSASAADSAF